MAVGACTAVLLAIGLRNPRIMLQDYPRDVQAAVPPKTLPSAGRRSGGASRSWASCSGRPLAAAVVARLQVSDYSFASAVTNAFLVLLAANVFDWLVLDWLVFCRLTPRFVVLPGTEGLPGYKDYAMHFRGFLISLGLGLVASAGIGGLTLLLPV